LRQKSKGTGASVVLTTWNAIHSIFVGSKGGASLKQKGPVISGHRIAEWPGPEIGDASLPAPDQYAAWFSVPGVANMTRIWPPTGGASMSNAKPVTPCAGAS